MAEELLILAGDIGGTKTNLALAAIRQGKAEVRAEASFPSQNFASLSAVCQAFLPANTAIGAAAFGIAGPVIDGQVRTTNLPWHILPDELSVQLGGAKVSLLNDLATTALGALHLPPDRFHWLQRGVARSGNIGVIAAGTGLGQAYLFHDGKRHIAAETEGGHTDFAPSNLDDERLLHYARAQFGRVSWERIVSGRGLPLIANFLHESEGLPFNALVQSRLDRGDDPGAVFGEAGVAGTCATSRRAVDWMVQLYGAQAGNLALTVMALGGIWIGGGLVGKLLPRMTTQLFVDAFCAKGRYAEMMRGIPIAAVLEPNASLIGALHAATELALSPK